MRKLYFFIGLLLFSLTGMTQDLTIYKFEDGKSPVIDGTVDEVWDLINPVDLTFQPTDDFGDASINAGWFKMGWKEDTLFLLILRDDDDFANQWETGLEDWKSDRDEIFLDVFADTLADGRGASDSQKGASYGHYQFTSIWVQNATEWVGNPNQWYHNAPFRFGYTFETEDIYYTEYAFPFSSLTIDQTLRPTGDATFQGGDGVTFGLQVVISDVDMADNPTDETFRKFLKWVDEGGWEDMDQAGKVLMDATLVSGLREETVRFKNMAYPNPAGDHVMISNVTISLDIEVYDVLGQLVLTRSNINSGTRIDIGSLSNGIYYIRLSNKEIIKFVKE
jgi:hypothetical protein